MTATAVVQATEPPRVLLTVTGLATDGDLVTVYRLVDGDAVPVRGAIDVLPDGTGTLVVTDLSAPFGVPVQYRVDQTDGGTGTVTSQTSNVVTLTAPGPWLSLPITGDAVQLTIVDWPEKSYKARQSLIAVAGRATPIAVSDKRIAAESTMVVLTRTRDDLMALRSLLEAGVVIQVRPVCGAVEAEYVAIGDVSETRYKPSSRATDGGTPAGSDWRRLVTMQCQVVDEPARTIPAVGDTLADLHAYVGGDTATLSTLHFSDFPSPATLLTIAQTALEGA